jgi:carboxylesterase
MLRKPERRSRRILYAIALAVAVTGASCAYNVGAGYLAEHAAAQEPRDPETGILLGAVPLDLGPEDADVAVLLVHGFVGGVNNFGDLPDRLAAQGWRVRGMRLPGHGTWPEDLNRINPDDLTSAVAEEYNDLRRKYPRVVLVGHSMGGALAAVTAAQHESPDALVLAAPYFGVTYKPYYVLRPETWTRLTYWAFRWVYKGEVFMQVNRNESKPRIFSYTWLPSHALVTLIEVGEIAADPQMLAKIDCPVLLIHGRQDVAASGEAAARALEAVPATVKEVVWLEKSNHHIFWDYEREEAVVAVVAFIQKALDEEEQPLQLSK